MARVLESRLYDFPQFESHAADSTIKAMFSLYQEKAKQQNSLLQISSAASGSIFVDEATWMQKFDEKT